MLTPIRRKEKKKEKRKKKRKKEKKEKKRKREKGKKRKREKEKIKRKRRKSEKGLTPTFLCTQASNPYLDFPLLVVADVRRDDSHCDSLKVNRLGRDTWTLAKLIVVVMSD